MSTLIISDNQAVAMKLRHALHQHDRECPVGNVISVENAVPHIQDGRFQPDLIVLVLPDDAERALEQLGRLRDCSPAKIVAVGSANDSQRILATLHAGADDYLDESGDLCHHLGASLQRLNLRQRATQKNGRILAVTSVCGGAGGSIVAANLAALLAKQYGSCALLDFDVRKGDQASLYNLTPRHSVADLCRNIETLDKNMLEQSLVKHPCGVHVLGAPRTLRETDQATPTGLRRTLHIARTAFPFLVVDYPDFRDEAQVGIFEGADLVLPVFRFDFTALRNLQRVLEFWQPLKIDPGKIHLVGNQYGQRKGLALRKIETALRKRIQFLVPDDPSLVNLSVNCGVPVVLESPGATFSKSLNRLLEGLSLIPAAPKSRWHKWRERASSLLAKCSLRNSSLSLTDLVRAG